MKRVLIREYSDLRIALAGRIKDCGHSHLEMDAVTGWADGYMGKLICGMRALGDMSLPTVLDALGLELALEPIDPDVDAALLARVPRLPPEAFAIEERIAL